MAAHAVGTHRRKAAPSWKLAEGFDSATQGIVVSGFAALPFAEALFLRQVSPGAAWLVALDGVAPVTDATGKIARAASIAFTGTGLGAPGLGLDDTVMATFAGPFREGMHQPDRSRRLGDDNPDALADGRMRWSGNAHDEPRTDQEVHALLLLYGSTADEVRSWGDQVLAAIAPQVGCEHRLALDLQFEAGIAREHFGFADGLSQPIPYGDAVRTDAGGTMPRDRWHGVRSGDILLGHVNAHNEPSPGPYVTDGDAGRQAGLVRGNAPEGCLDLGCNGSYMVVRELRQDVPAFWTSLDREAAAIRRAEPAADQVTPDWLAERIVGRTRDGHLLHPRGLVEAGRDGMPGNEVGFIHGDPHGHGCPMGSHVRRANPRDGLAKDAASAQTLLDAANNHRILRRGRKYGPKAADPRVADGQERGLLFMCLNTDLVRQFEFVQQTWMLNRNFATLYDQTDPLLGPKGTFTVHDLPVRRLVEVETFVRMAGGDYFFLPSMPALRYFRTLP